MSNNNNHKIKVKDQWSWVLSWWWKVSTRFSFARRVSEVDWNSGAFWVVLQTY